MFPETRNILEGPNIELFERYSGHCHGSAQKNIHLMISSNVSKHGKMCIRSQKARVLKLVIFFVRLISIT
jgi:hypothetical protein